MTNTPPPPRETWTIDDLRHLPAVIDIVTAGQILGIGRTKAYELAKHNQFPCLVLRIGTLYRVPTAELARFLGITADERDSEATAHLNSSSHP